MLLHSHDQSLHPVWNKVYINPHIWTLKLAHFQMSRKYLKNLKVFIILWHKKVCSLYYQYLVHLMWSPSNSLANKETENRNNNDPVRACNFPTKPFCHLIWDSSTLVIVSPPVQISITLSITSLKFFCRLSHY